MIFTNQALALFPPALGQAIAHTQRDRQELVEEICCRIGQVPVLLTQTHVYPAECRAILAGDLDYLLERATGASVYAAGEQIRQNFFQFQLFIKCRSIGGIHYEMRKLRQE